MQMSGNNMQMGQQGLEKSSSNTTTLNVSDYPELQSAKEGSPVAGNFKGTVRSNDGKTVVVEYSEVSLNMENMADKELGRLQGKSSGGQVEDEDE